MLSLRLATRPSIWHFSRYLSSKAADAVQKPAVETADKIKSTQVGVKPNINDKIKHSESVPELLTLSKSVNRDQAQMILLKLAQLSVIGKADRGDLEKDKRFQKLRAFLTTANAENSPKQVDTVEQSSIASTDMEIIQKVATLNQAAEMLTKMNGSELALVLSMFAKENKRNLPLIKSVAEKIVSKRNLLTLKASSNILHALGKLNFYHFELLRRVSFDIQAVFKKGKDLKVAPIRSIISSLGFLRYKDQDLLATLVDWSIKNKTLYRSKDLASIFATLNSLNCQGIAESMYRSVSAIISLTDLTALERLNYVWSLAALELAGNEELQAVLNQDFVRSMESDLQGNLTPAIKMKLLNINAWAKLQPNYNGPLLDNQTQLFEYPYAYRQSKSLLVNGLHDTLKYMFSSDSFQKDVNIKQGFKIDALCALNEKQTPIKLQDAEGKNAFLIAFVVLDFHDMCLNDPSEEPSGQTAFAIKLLKKQGYSVIALPQSEFSTSEKITQRVQYIDGRLKQIIRGDD